MELQDLHARLDARGVRMIVGHLADTEDTITGHHEERTIVGADAATLSDTNNHRGLYVDRKGRVWVLSTGRDQPVTVGLLEDDGEPTQAQTATVKALKQIFSGRQPPGKVEAADTRSADELAPAAPTSTVVDVTPPPEPKRPAAKRSTARKPTRSTRSKS